MLNGYVSVPCNINVMSGVIYIEGEIKQISKGHPIASEDNKKHKSPLRWIYVLVYVFITVSVGSVLHFLDNE